MACNHKFQGHKNGVTCLLCGLRMTAAEYSKYVHPPDKAEIPKRTRKKKEVSSQ